MNQHTLFQSLYTECTALSIMSACTTLLSIVSAFTNIVGVKFVVCVGGWALAGKHFMPVCLLFFFFFVIQGTLLNLRRTKDIWAIKFAFFFRNCPCVLCKNMIVKLLLSKCVYRYRTDISILMAFLFYCNVCVCAHQVSASVYVLCV